MKIKLQKPGRKQLIPITLAALLVGSLAVTFTSLTTAPKSQSVLVAAKDLAEGEKAEPTDFIRVQLPLGSYASTYLSAYKSGLKFAHSISKGQLVAKRDLAGMGVPRVPIRLNNLKPISKAISVGDFIDVWATDLSPTAMSAPEPIAFGAVVTAIETNNSMTQNSTNVEISVDESFLEAILAATDSRFQISLILRETLADEQ